MDLNLLNSLQAKHAYSGSAISPTQRISSLHALSNSGVDIFESVKPLSVQRVDLQFKGHTDKKTHINQTDVPVPGQERRGHLNKSVHTNIKTDKV
jgi:hypothetical protein